MLCYTYIYDRIFIIRFLKPNMNYMQPQGQPFRPRPPNLKFRVRSESNLCYGVILKHFGFLKSENFKITRPNALLWK